MYCSNCGKKLKSSQNFCDGCGHKVLDSNKTNKVTELESEAVDSDIERGFFLGDFCFCHSYTQPIWDFPICL